MAAPWLLESGLSEAIKADTDFISKCPSIAADVEGRSIALATLVERLGGVLTDLDSDIRERGTRVLASVLDNISTDFLTQPELKFISSFFSDRLVDHQFVIPAVLQGILAISEMRNLAGEDMRCILQAMFRHVHCQSQIQSDRKKFYLIIRCFLYRATKEMQTMGPDFVFGVLSAMDGERDPRNLSLLFALLPPLLALCPPRHLAEDVFEVVACYFPVDFQSASADPDAVTREALAEALTSVLTALPEFAEFCLPLLMEKLDSSLRVAKTDVLSALVAACDKFAVASLEQQLPSLWPALKLEALPGADPEIRLLALRALSALIARLSAEEAPALTDLLDLVVAAGRDALRQVEPSVSAPAICLLAAAAAASPSACSFVAAKTVPALLREGGASASRPIRTQLLGATSALLAACAGFNAPPPQPAALLAAYLQAGIAVGDGSAPLRAESLRGLPWLLPFLEPDQWDEVYAMLADRTLAEEDIAVRQALCRCVKSLAELQPTELRQRLLADRLELTPAEPALSRLVQVRCSIAAVSSLAVVAATPIIELALSTSHAPTCLTALASLGSLAATATEDGWDLGCCHDEITAWWMGGARVESAVQSGAGVFADLDVLTEASRLVFHVLRTRPHGEQSVVVSHLLEQFLDDESSSFQPLNPGSPPLQTRCVLLLEAVLGASRQETIAGLPTLPTLLTLGRRLLALAADSTDAATAAAAARLVGLLLNKAPPSAVLEQLLDFCFERSGGPPASVAGWVAKAMLLRGHPRSSQAVDTLAALLRQPEPAVHAFTVLLADSGHFMDVTGHANVRPLYKQRVLTLALRLVDGFRLAPPPVQSNCSALLAVVLRETPHRILVVEIAQTLPLLVDCLSTDQSELLLASLTSLSRLADAEHEALPSRFSTLVPRCLLLARTHVSMKVRIASLDCVFNFTKYPTLVLLPFKPEVVCGLSVCVDDRKRLVRRSAVQARTRWFLVGSPGEPTDG